MEQQNIKDSAKRSLVQKVCEMRESDKTTKIKTTRKYMEEKEKNIVRTRIIHAQRQSRKLPTTPDKKKLLDK